MVRTLFFFRYFSRNVSTETVQNKWTNQDGILIVSLNLLHINHFDHLIFFKFMLHFIIIITCTLTFKFPFRFSN